MRNQQHFSYKGQTVNILDFGDPTVSVAATQLCSYNAKAAINDT